MCNKSYMNSADYNDHKCKFSRVQEYCSLCNTGIRFGFFIIQNFSVLYFHFAVYFSVFDSDEQLKMHLSTHKEIVLLKTESSESLLCSNCNEEFSSYFKLFAHVENKCSVSSMSTTSPEAAQNDIKLNKEVDDRINQLKPNQYHSCQHCNET